MQETIDRYVHNLKTRAGLQRLYTQAYGDAMYEARKSDCKSIGEKSIFCDLLCAKEKEALDLIDADITGQKVYLEFELAKTRFSQI